LTKQSPPPTNQLTRAIFKNTIFITFGGIALKLVNFIFSLYIVRRLGDNRFGQYSVVIAFVSLFQIFAELGITQFSMREIAQDRSKTERLFWNVLALRFLLALLAIPCISLAAVGSHYSNELILGIMLYTCTFLFAAFEAPLTMVLTAYERFDYATGMTILEQITFAILGTVFLLTGKGFLWLIVAGMISFLPGILLGWFAVSKHRLLKFKIEISPRYWPTLLRSSLPFGIITLTLTIAYGIDAVMLKMFWSDEVVGWYKVSYGLVFSIMFLIRGFKEAMVPSLSRTFVDDPEQVEKWYFRTVKVIIMLALPIAVGGMMVAFPLVEFLLTPDYFPHSAIALRILIWDVPFLMFTAFCGNMATVTKQEKQAAYIYAINALANVILNLITIPRYGYVAASIVTVLTDIIGAVQFHFLLSRQLRLPNLRSVGLRVGLAAALMGLVLWAAQDLHVLLLIPLGGVVYAILVVAMGVFDEYEWELITRLLRKVHISIPLKNS